MASVNDGREPEQWSDSLATEETYRAQLAAVVFEWRPARAIATAPSAASTLWMSRSAYRKERART